MIKDTFEKWRFTLYQLANKNDGKGSISNEGPGNKENYN